MCPNGAQVCSQGRKPLGSMPPTPLSPAGATDSRHHRSPALPRTIGGPALLDPPDWLHSRFNRRLPCPSEVRACCPPPTARTTFHRRISTCHTRAAAPHHAAPTTVRGPPTCPNGAQVCSQGRKPLGSMPPTPSSPEGATEIRHQCRPALPQKIDGFASSWPPYRIGVGDASKDAAASEWYRFASSKKRSASSRQPKARRATKKASCA